MSTPTFMPKWISRLFCSHEWRNYANLYGDQINAWSTSRLVRSVWECSKCGKLQGREKLHDDGDLRGVAGPLQEQGWD